MRIHPDDAAAHGIADGDVVRISTAAGAVEAVAAVTADAARGQMGLPNGQGLSPAGAVFGDGGEGVGTPPNALTSSDHVDDLIGTPLHKHVPARLERIG